jgi:hypothetical protein
MTSRCLSRWATGELTSSSGSAGRSPDTQAGASRLSQPAATPSSSTWGRVAERGFAASMDGAFSVSRSVTGSERGAVHSRSRRPLWSGRVQCWWMRSTARAAPDAAERSPEPNKWPRGRPVAAAAGLPDLMPGGPVRGGGRLGRWRRQRPAPLAAAPAVPAVVRAALGQERLGGRWRAARRARSPSDCQCLPARQAASRRRPRLPPPRRRSTGPDCGLGAAAPVSQPVPLEILMIRGCAERRMAGSRPRA